MGTQTLIEAWDNSYRDVEEALGGIDPDHLHIRPAPGTIAISELIAHIASTEAQIVVQYIVGHRMDSCNSPIVQEDLVYPPRFSGEPIRASLSSLSLSELKSELEQVHHLCYEAIKDLELPTEHVFDDDWADTPLGERLEYAAYHVAYHIGQIFLTRHMLGEETPDN